MSKITDLTGQKFGKLTVVNRAENHVSNNGNKRVVWHCKCECGNEVDVMALNLTRNHTISCGCARSDGRKKLTRDITGQRFGYLTAIRRIDGKTRTTWLFKCDCGNEIEALLSNVASGKTQSCGKRCGLKNHPYDNKPQKGFRGDLTGERFGKLVVIEKMEDKEGYTQFLCQCDCGNQKIVSGSCLKYGITKSCSCLHKEIAGKSKYENLIGQRFGKLVVIGIAESRYAKNHWLCRCDCGNETVVSTTGLKSGHTQSCGCYQDQVASDTHFVDLTGKTFGKLYVIERVENSNTGLVRYLCQCECGNKTTVIGGHLSGGKIQSCGCWVYSRLEECVIEFLRQKGYVNGIDYECQKKFDDLTGTGGYLLSYDFVIYDESKPIFLIECQGQQHYNPIDFFGGAEQFEKQQIHDELKRKYAQKIDVPLIEIPYSYTDEQIIEKLVSIGL